MIKRLHVILRVRSVLGLDGEIAYLTCRYANCGLHRETFHGLYGCHANDVGGCRL